MEGNLMKYVIEGIVMVAACILLAFTLSEDDTYENRYDAFETFSAQGEQANCSEILSTTTELISGYYNWYKTSYNVVDYIRTTGSTFAHCDADLKPVVTKECLRVTAEYKEGLRANLDGSTSWLASSGYDQLCKLQLTEVYSSFKDDYELASTGFLKLYEGQDIIALRPANIERITFEEVVRNKLWSAEIQIKERGAEILLFGDKRKWDSAVENLTKF